MSNKVKLLFDVTILGLGSNVPRGRTGIFRATKNIMEQLVQDDEIDIVLWSGQYSYLTKIYLLHFQKNAIQHYNNKYQSITDRCFDRCQRWLCVSSFKMSDTAQDFYVKIIKFFLLYIERLLCSLDYLSHMQNVNVIHFTSYYFRPLLLLFRKKNVAYIHTIYDLIPIKYPEYFNKADIFLFKHYLRRINNKKDLIICNSESTKMDICKYLNISSSKVHVVPLAASDKFCKNTNKGCENIIRNKYNIGKSRYILSIATIEPRKNLLTLIKAFDELLLCQEYSDIKLVLVGAMGWKYDDIFNYISEHPGLKSKIIFTGFVKDHELPIIYSNALVFVYISKYEGFGLPILEAMKCGNPIIASNRSSLPEVVGNAGLLVDPDNINSVKAAIHTVVTNKKVRTMMEKASLIRSNSYSWERTLSELKNIYKIAVKSSEK